MSHTEITCIINQLRELLQSYTELLERTVLTVAEKERPMEPAKERLLKKAVATIESNMSCPSFSVYKMAREMGMSRNNMCRKLKAASGLAPSELIKDIRLKNAASHLLNQTGSVAQISSAVGMKDHSYFSKLFKKQYGVTPSDYFKSKQVNSAPTRLWI